MPSDTVEGRTVFIRNLSFDVTNDELYSFFVEFGPLEFAKVVKDPTSLHSRGMAFVKFTDATVAARVLRDSSKPENADRFTLGSRVMLISIAVSREEVQQLRMGKFESTEPTNVSDKTQSFAERTRSSGRNLHLARVGIIRPGTAAADGMPKEDMARREALLRTKKLKLQNPNIFISDLRLCIRNLPLSVSDELLKRACQNVLGEKSKRSVTECRVMRNLQPGRQQFRSLGYAFVSFTKHDDALAVLHAFNNNPDVFNSQRRPIVEFSLENILALEKKRRRADRCANIETKRQANSTQKNPSFHPAVQLHRPTKSLKRSAKAQLGSTRILPKRLGAKIRHRDRGRPDRVVSTKPKDRLSRKQLRLKRKHRVQ